MIALGGFYFSVKISIKITSAGEISQFKIQLLLLSMTSVMSNSNNYMFIKGEAHLDMYVQW